MIEFISKQQLIDALDAVIQLGDPAPNGEHLLSAEAVIDAVKSMPAITIDGLEEEEVE